LGISKGEGLLGTTVELKRTGGAMEGLGSKQVAAVVEIDYYMGITARDEVDEEVAGGSNANGIVKFEGDNLGVVGGIGRYKLRNTVFVHLDPESTGLVVVGDNLNLGDAGIVFLEVQTEDAADIFEKQVGGAGLCIHGIVGEITSGGLHGTENDIHTIVAEGRRIEGRSEERR
jgi:hypothetical protein